jgi:hypothetical protein
MTAWEYADRPGRDDEKPDVAEDLAFAYERRGKPLNDGLRALEVEMREAEALWESALAEAYNALRACQVDLTVSVSLYINHGRHKPEYERIGMDERHKVERVIWPMGTSTPPDEFQQKLDAAIAMFEERLRPHLRRRAG